MMFPVVVKMGSSEKPAPDFGAGFLLLDERPPHRRSAARFFKGTGRAKRVRKRSIAREIPAQNEIE
jgi:hypothetical protein